MGIDIAGATIVKTAGISLNSLVFDASGRGSANPTTGYNGAKNSGSTYYSGVSGWEINSADWQSGLNLTNGVFTCPVAGIYAVGWDGIHNGGSNVPAGQNTYGYGGFAKNGALTYFVHWNMSQAAGSAAWHSGGSAALFNCAAGDTLALFINRAPTSVAPNTYAQNLGLYPNEHHCVWCKLVG
jgi:hypothetical protein